LRELTLSPLPLAGEGPGVRAPKVFAKCMSPHGHRLVMGSGTIAIEHDLDLRLAALLVGRDVRLAGFAEEAGMAEPTSRGTGPEGPRADDRRNVWVERWKQGIDPEESFRKIFHHYSRIIYKFFAKRGFNEAECEDLVQETFLRVHRNLDSFRGDSQFGTWLFQVSANVYKNELRSRMAQKRDAQEVALDDGEPHGSQGSGMGGTGVSLEAEEDGALDGLLTVERSAILRRAMAELPPQMRRCVELRVNHDLKYREIAVLMGVSIDTVKAHLFQARQLLKAKLGSYFAEPRFADSNV
jgi:RNA polymerase sigma-70 factor, ECF subfamily